MTSLTIRSPHRSSSEASEPIAAGSLSSPWRWMVIACLLLGISGGIRFWREQQFATLAAKNSLPPFSLNELPRSLGDWRSEEKTDGQLRTDVARIAGSSDHIIRNYLNEKSGDQITAMVLYGLAEKVFGHTPDVCYPATGHELAMGPVDRELRLPGLKNPVRYRWAIYMKRTGGGIRTYEEAYHAFFYNGEWVPDASDQWKMFRYQPAMFKIQLGRPVSGLDDEAHGPSEALLGGLIQEICNRVAPETTVGTGKTATTAEPPATVPASLPETGAG